MWASLVNGMKWILESLYQFTDFINLPSYALAIVLFTIIIKTILYPLTLKQMKSMTMMQQIAPQLKEIQDKYKNKDPQKLQQKTLELYQKYNINPLAGCLPLLIQMPILIALYQALLNFEYTNPEHAGFFWIGSLNQTGDPFYIIPVLAALTTYLQSRITVNAQDPTQKIMLYTMPLFIAWITTTVPAGLGIYWITFNLVGMLQQFFVNKQTLAIKEALAEGANSRKKS